MCSLLSLTELMSQEPGAVPLFHHRLITSHATDRVATSKHHAIGSKFNRRLNTDLVKGGALLLFMSLHRRTGTQLPSQDLVVSGVNTFIRSLWRHVI